MLSIEEALGALSLAVDKPQRMILLHYQTRQPLRDPAGNEGWVDVYSGDSQIARRHDREVLRRIYKMRGRATITPEETEANETDLLVSLTADWKLLSLDGTPLEVPFSPENARRIYGAPAARWIRDQVFEFQADRGNFTPVSSPTSLNGPRTSSELTDKP
jgi:hypothetical protein